ncbi:MAG: translation initiation factor IF-2 [Planctomycetia bacterium]|nr:translation initiation factor IF-2 [Planctomycetia bacterium]
MVVRIYSLAKELKLDSKVLVDICTRAGVPGKGSALASLTEEEVVKVKNFMAGGGAKAAAASAPVAVATAASATLSAPLTAPIAPVIPKATGRVPVLRSPSDKKSAASSSPTVEPPTEVESAPAPTAVEPVKPAPAPAAPVSQPPAIAASSTSSAEPPAMRREDYMAPGGTMGRSPLSRPLMRGDKSEKVDGPKKAADQKPRMASVRVGRMPAVEQPKASVTSNEPAPQKPDLKLPMDAIRASKVGGKPLQAHLKKHEDRRKAEIDAAAVAKTPAGRAAAAAAARNRPAAGSPMPMDDAARERARKAGVGGKGVPTGDALTLREQRQLGRKKKPDDAPAKRINAITGLEEDVPAPKRIHHTSRRRTLQSTGANTAAPRKGKVVVEFPCTVRSFSETLGVRAPQVLMKLLQLGMPGNINTELNAETVEMLAVEFGIEIEMKQPPDAEAELLASMETLDENPDEMEPRAPVVTFLGHVDHGKTSLLDRLVGLNVVAGESGGITQHIRAYRIEKDGRPITVVDTPGHEAFTEMRARGANVTDIAVIVVAANDGVMPQTEEAISHARAAGVPIVVALNKVDLPGINYDRVFSQLVTAGLQPTEWGGDTELVRVSAQTGQGMPELLETLLTISDLHDLRANPHRDAYGTCLEADMSEGRGVSVKCIVQKGTLKVGDVVVCGAAHGRVKALYDTLKTREELKEAGPSMPVTVTGLDVPPNAGDHFYVVDDIAKAREIATKRAVQQRSTTLGMGPAHATLETLFEKLGNQEDVQTLNLIIRADVRGSIEALQKELSKLTHPEVQIKILQASVGGVSEADVYLADASDAIIIAFNVVPDMKARLMAENRGVQIRRYEIIYKVSDDLKLALEGMLKPEQREIELGRALVQKAFAISRVGTVAGCRVLSGTIERNSRVRIIRDSRIVGDYALDTLKREKDDTREVREGMECGIKLAGFNDIKEGDVLESYKVEEVARTL